MAHKTIDTDWASKIDALLVPLLLLPALDRDSTICTVPWC